MSQWLTVTGAAKHAKCGPRSIYNGVKSGKLRAARLGGRRELRFLPEWVDGWLIETSVPEVINTNAPGAGTREGVFSGSRDAYRQSTTRTPH
jgi:excisionase family DNA binding protein